MKRLNISIIFIIAPLFIKAQQWTPLQEGIGGGFPYVYSILEDSLNNTMIVGGSFDQAGSTNANNIASWNGSNWDTLDAGTNGQVRVIETFNGELYAGGFFSMAGGVSASSIARWNGQAWDSVGSGLQSGYAPYAMEVYGGELYIGGVFNTLGNGTWVDCITKWDGANYQPVGGGVSGPFLGNTQINALTVYDGELYAGGYFDQAGTAAVSNIAKWDGTSWSSVGSGVNDVIFCMAVYNGELYVGGAFDSTGGINSNYIAKWDGTNWDSLGYGTNFNVMSMYSTDSLLYIGGWFSMVDSVDASRIARWDGVQWDSIGVGFNKDVLTISRYNNHLFAGGRFTRSGLDTVNYIAKWDDLLDAGQLFDPRLSTKIYPNPSKDLITIEIENYEVKKLSLVLYDSQGRAIRTLENLNSAQISINTDGFSSGLYVIHMIANNRVIGREKVIIE